MYRNEEVVKALGIVKAVKDLLNMGIQPSEGTLNELNKGIAILDNFVYERIADDIIDRPIKELENTVGE